MTTSNRYNHYHVQIMFDNDKRLPILTNTYINYLNNNNNLDTLIIFTDEIYLISSRNKIFSKDDILYNNSNSISKQVLKSLVFFYCNSFNYITNIKITRKTAKKEEVVLNLNAHEIKQPLENNPSLRTTFETDKIKVILQETALGNTILNSLSYYLRGLTSNEKFYKFERYWRSINGIYRFHSQSTSDFEGIKHLREFIINNQNLFPLTIAEINQYSGEYLRNSFRWRGLILNDYPTQKDTKKYADFIKRYSDKRVMVLLLNTLPYRNDFLNAENLYGDVSNHINTNIQNNTKNDGELIALLVLKYTYFVRNKMFHGEIPESSFKYIETKDDAEIDKLNNLLETFIIELINNNDKLQTTTGNIV